MVTFHVRIFCFVVVMGCGCFAVPSDWLSISKLDRLAITQYTLRFVLHVFTRKDRPQRNPEKSPGLCLFSDSKVSGSIFIGMRVI